MMRKSLRELYGLEGNLLSQYTVFWKRIEALSGTTPRVRRAPMASMASARDVGRVPISAK